MTSEARGRAALALGAAAALAYLVLLPQAALWLRMLVKPLPVLCLAAWAWPKGRARGARLVASGLLVSAVGDALMEPPRLFLAGLAVFLVAHLCYTAAFLLDTRAPRLARAVPFAAWGLAAYAVIAPVLGALAWPVAAYVVVICVMMWRAAARVGATGRPRPGEWWALAGAVLFAASDTLIAFHRFLTRWPDAPYIIMVLYWAGQAALARSARAGAGIRARFEYHHAGPPAA